MSIDNEDFNARMIELQQSIGDVEEGVDRLFSMLDTLVRISESLANIDASLRPLAKCAKNGHVWIRIDDGRI